MHVVIKFVSRNGVRQLILICVVNPVNNTFISTSAKIITSKRNCLSSFEQEMKCMIYFYFALNLLLA